MRSLKIFAVGAVTPVLFALCSHVLRGNNPELLFPASLPAAAHLKPALSTPDGLKPHL